MRAFCLFTIAMALLGQHDRFVFADPPTIDLPELTVVAIDHLDVPARRTGQIQAIYVREGESVEPGQAIGKLADDQARLSLQLAENELQRAKLESENDSHVRLAIANKNASEHEVKRQNLLVEIASVKSDNPIGTQSAMMAQAVAKNELRRAEQARTTYQEAVSNSELEALRLSHAQAMLQVKQAELDFEVSQKQSKAERASLDQSKSNVVRASAEVESVHANRKVERLEVIHREKQLALAKLTLSQHEFVSPIDGVISERYVQVGSWVREGDRVASVIHLKKLRAEGFASVDDLDQLHLGQRVRLVINRASRPIKVDGEISFIHPIIDATSQEMRIWIDFPNADGKIRPGMRASAVEFLDSREEPTP